MTKKRSQVSEQHKQLDQYLQNVYKEHIRLQPSELKINNCIIHKFHAGLRHHLLKDQLFKMLYSNTFFGGSYYDGLKVSKPDEYDIMFQMKIPGEVDVISGRLYGYAQVEVLSEGDVDSLIDTSNYLSVSAVNNWFRGIVNSAIDQMKQENRKLYKIIGVKSNSPATTIILENRKHEEISIDFVPGFWFSSEFWPDNCVKEPEGMNLGFSVVPKTIKIDTEQNDRNFRFCFSPQERLLIKNKLFLKPAIKLLKYLRDEENHHPLKSYFIKNVALLELKLSSIPVNRMATAFLHLLKELQSLIEEGDLPYYWNPNGFNLISDFSAELKENLTNRLAKIIRNIEDLNWSQMDLYFNM